MTDRSNRTDTLLQGRKERIAKALLRPLPEPSSLDGLEPLTEESRTHLVEYAEELYWNEMEWENLTAEEETGFEMLPQLIFPGFLAYVRGLLLREVMEDALAPAAPRPEVVGDVLRFLAGRVLELDEELANADEGGAKLRTELALTSHLLDLALYTYHGLTEAEVERIEEVRPAEGAAIESGSGGSPA